MKVETIKAELERRRKIIEPNLPSNEKINEIFDRVGFGNNTDFNIGSSLGAYTMLRKIQDFVNDDVSNPVDYWYKKYFKEKEKNGRIYKIRDEIERLKHFSRGGSEYSDGCLDICEELLSFIDSLEEKENDSDIK